MFKVNNKVLIRGYYGNRNIGDEAMLLVLIGRLKYRGLDPIIASKNVVYSERIHGVPACRSRIDARFIKEFIKCKYVVEGPGNKHGFISMIDLGLPIFAKLLFKKVEYTGLGFNPNTWSDHPTIDIEKEVKLSNPIKRAILKYLFNVMVDKLSVRDDGSKRFLMINGVEERKILVENDLAFSLVANHSEEIYNDVFVSENIDKIFIGISVRRFKNDNDNNHFIEFLERLVKTIVNIDKNVTFVFIPFSFGLLDNDIEYSKIIINNFNGSIDGFTGVVANYDDPRIIKGLVSKCDFMICVRYHSHIFAESEGIPYMAIVYDPKSLDVLSKSTNCIKWYKITNLQNCIEDAALQINKLDIFKQEK